MLTALDEIWLMSLHLHDGDQDVFLIVLREMLSHFRDTNPDDFRQLVRQVLDEDGPLYFGTNV